MEERKQHQLGGAVGAVAGAGTEYLIDALVKSDN